MLSLWIDSPISCTEARVLLANSPRVIWALGPRKMISATAESSSVGRVKTDYTYGLFARCDECSLKVVC